MWRIGHTSITRAPAAEMRAMRNAAGVHAWDMACNEITIDSSDDD